MNTISISLYDYIEKNSGMRKYVALVVNECQVVNKI